ncbi:MULTISPECIES: hypothetical protein [Calothrix]|uniref:Transposase n=2 Tax=Calothrix TaxID=1186 RepID=A0ABR8AK52_9CYAN|nr:MULTISPECIES: hypothetical protein [Calothrix]MBD2198982.1 hypothetical protein [Calothrix parietina FACHB-288]MBD2227684.1 hypothetical protein [Calothrix anomala FACHB-343]
MWNLLLLRLPISRRAKVAKWRSHLHLHRQTCAIVAECNYARFCGYEHRRSLAFEYQVLSFALIPYFRLKSLHAML